MTIGNVLAETRRPRGQAHLQAPPHPADPTYQAVSGKPNCACATGKRPGSSRPACARLPCAEPEEPHHARKMVRPRAEYPESAPAGSRRRLALRRWPAVESLEERQLLSTFTVSNEADGGNASFCQAIITRLAPPPSPNSPNVISFSGLSNLVQIQLRSQLPTITQPVIIDGTTANSYNGNHPFVQLIGSYAGSGVLGLDIAASGTQVKAWPSTGLTRPRPYQRRLERRPQPRLCLPRHQCQRDRPRCEWEHDL